MLPILLQPAFLWFYACTFFLVLEIFAPGFIAIFFSFGCLSASLAAWLFGVNTQWQITIFCGATLVSLLTLRKLFLATFSGKQSSDDDDYDSQYIGTTITVTKAISPTQQGEIKLAGSFWLAVADYEMAVGDNGVVVGRDAHNALIIKVKPT